MNLYLINYSNVKSTQGQSITALPFSEASQLANRLYQNSNCTAHRRFGPAFARYYNDRQKAEQQLYTYFLNAGGNPQIKHPIYFIVQFSENQFFDFGGHQTLAIPLDSIADTDVSFSLGDSMALYYQEKLDRVLTKNELFELLDSSEPEAHKKLDCISQEHGFIEAQLWTTKYFNQQK